MKAHQIIALVAILCAGGCSHAPVANSVDLTPAIASVDKADLSLTKAIKSNDKKQIVQQVQAAKSELQVTRKSLLSQQELARKVAETRDWWINHSAEQDKIITKLEAKVSHFNRLLFLASSLAGVLVGIVVGRFAMLFSPYGVVLGAAAGIAAGGATWLVLAHL